MRGVYRFDETSEVGRFGELAAMEYFNKVGWPVVDVTRDPEYRKQDIDFFAQINARWIGFEVKADRYRGTGNLYVEEVSNLGRGTPGCMLYTLADYLLYYFIRQGRALAIPVPAFQSWAARNLHQYRPVSPQTRGIGRILSTSRGYPVPEADIRRGVRGIIDLRGLPIWKER